VEGEVVLVLKQPGAGFFDGVAVGDTVEGNGHGVIVRGKAGLL